MTVDPGNVNCVCSDVGRIVLPGVPALEGIGASVGETVGTTVLSSVDGWEVVPGDAIGLPDGGV